MLATTGLEAFAGAASVHLAHPIWVREFGVYDEVNPNFFRFTGRWAQVGNFLHAEVSSVEENLDIPIDSVHTLDDAFRKVALPRLRVQSVTYVDRFNWKFSTDVVVRQEQVFDRGVKQTTLSLVKGRGGKAWVWWSADVETNVADFALLRDAQKAMGNPSSGSRNASDRWQLDARLVFAIRSPSLDDFGLCVGSHRQESTTTWKVGDDDAGVANGPVGWCRHVSRR